MRAKFIKESVADLLQPKSETEIQSIIPSKIIDFVDECYSLITMNPQKFEIVSNIGFIGNGYAFQFETKYPLEQGDIVSEYHVGEIGEFTLGYFPEFDGVFIIFENNGSDYQIETIEELQQYLNIVENEMNESITDIFVPKSEEFLRNKFNEDHPIFAKLAKDMFPNDKYTLNPGEDGLDAHFAFNVKDKEGKEHTFLISQNRYIPYPQISYLNRSRAGVGYSGIFTNPKRVETPEQVKKYVESIIEPEYK